MYDHLGSIRVVVNEAGNIVSSDDYDPWGMIMDGRSTDDNYYNAKYKFTGKERDKETGYDYFGARYYDSRIGRWLVVDPLFKNYPEISPYVYTLNNPVIFIDLVGKQVLVPDPFFSYGFSKGFFNTLESSVTGLYETVTNPLETGKRTLSAFMHPTATLEAIGSSIGNWAGRLISANPIESGEAFGEAAAIAGEMIVGTKGISKISSITKLSELSRFSSVEKLIGSIEKFEKLTSGTLQGSIKGVKGIELFEKLAKEYGIELKEGVKGFKTSEGTYIGWHLSKETKEFTLDINKNDIIYKIRVEK
jgi:RHS repeat-associated protein